MNDLTKWAAERHNRDVRIILTELRREDQAADRLVDAVVDAAFQIEAARDETNERHRAGFGAWARLILATTPSDDAGLDRAPWNESLKKILRAYLSIADSVDKAPGNLGARIGKVDAQAETTLSADALEIAQVVSGVLQGSVTFWRDDPDTQFSAKKGRAIDKSQVVRSDVMGAITGAAGAAVATWWTTPPVTGGAVAGPPQPGRCSDLRSMLCCKTPRTTRSKTPSPHSRGDT